MFQSSKLSRALKGLRPFALNGPKVLQATATQADETGDISEHAEDGTGPELDEPALQRLLSRAEAELSEPDAIQRRTAMARLKVAAVNGRR